MQILKKIYILSFFFISLPVFAQTSIVQAGTIINLMQGIYTGSTSFADLEKTSDLGLGTSNGLGGELVILDGNFYLADENGDVKQLPLSEKTPYAITAKFAPQQQFTLQNINNLTELEQTINNKLSSNNLFYVIKVEGEFSYIKARSVKAPTKPYPPLEEVVKTNQHVFDFNSIKGTLVIFKSPAFVSPLSVPNYHIHFISEDKKKAGHVFDVKIANAKISIMETNQFELLLPESPDYLQANLNPVSASSIHAAESQR